jgi:DNA-binding phage protein
MTCPSPNLDTGQSNTRWHDALSENGNPTLTSVLGALGLELTVQKKAA